MIQAARLHRRLLPELGAAPAWTSAEELEKLADARVASLLRLRRLHARAYERPWVALDDVLRTDEQEHFDEPDYPESKRLTLARHLHRFNRVVLNYRRFLSVLRPLIEEVADRQGRPARLLELASGSGEFAIELARLAGRAGLPVEVLGSDVQASYVRAAQARADALALPVRFQRIDAFELDRQPAAAFDLVFIANSLHHFTPGQLARIVASGHRLAGSAFVAMDGYRSLYLLAFLALATLPLSGSLDFLHDSVITGRKFYSLAELELVARLAAPRGRVRVRASHPGYSVLTVQSS